MKLKNTNLNNISARLNRKIGLKLDNFGKLHTNLFSKNISDNNCSSPSAWVNIFIPCTLQFVVEFPLNLEENIIYFTLILYYTIK